MMAWVVYALAVSALLTVAAVLWEGVVRSLGGAVRWVWGTAMLLSAGLPLVMGMVRAGADAVPAPVSLDRLTSAPVLSGAATDGVPWWARLPESLAGIESLLLPLWVAGSAVLLLLLLVGTARLRRSARGWPRVRLPQGDALLSESFGPALIGAIRPTVVLPRWALSLGRAPLEMILAHEEEHRRNGDVPLLMAGALLVAVLPWNPLLWFQLRRLRAAVELDCDRRVLRRGIPPVPYAELLLELSARPRGRMTPWAALAARPSLLERRLTMIVRGTKRVNRTQLAVAALGAAGLVLLACETQAPPLAPETEVPTAEAEMEFQAGELHRAASPLVFVDGKRVDNAAMREIPAASIERIEVIKGAAARATHGPEAEAGVIQIYLKETPEGAEGGAVAQFRALRLPGALGEIGAEARAEFTTPAETEVPLDRTPGVAGQLQPLHRSQIEKVEVLRQPDGGEGRVHVDRKGGTLRPRN